MKYVELAPLAITSDGALFINAAVTTKATDFETVARAAAKEKRAVFIGIMLTSEETDFAMARLDNAADETAARIAGSLRPHRRDTSRSGK